MNRPWTPLLVAATLLLSSAFLSACGSKPERGANRAPTSDLPSEAAVREASGTREAALRALDSLRRGALQSAFANLERYGYRRRVQTEQLDADGRATASEERVVRHPAGAGSAEVLRSDSSGGFDFGRLGSFTSAESGESTPANLARYVLPEEPAFLSERSAYAFQYRLLPDTTLGGRTARVVAVRAHPQEGDDQALRSARLYLDGATGRLVAARLHRVRRSMFFDEDTRLFLRLRPAPGASSGAPSGTAWVPAKTRFQTRLDLPLRPERCFRTTSTYSRYRRPT